MIQPLCQPLRADRGYTGITVPLPLIVVGDRTSKSSDLIVGLGLPVSLHVSDLLEIPKIVTSTNLLGNLLSSMGAPWKSGWDCRPSPYHWNYRRRRLKRSGTSYAPNDTAHRWCAKGPRQSPVSARKS